MEISDLFHRQRLVSDSPFWNIIIVLYIPIGILLATIRLFVFIQLGLLLRLLPKELPLRRWWFRGVQPGLGFWVSSEGFGDYRQVPKALVANHVSIIDHAIMESLMPCLAVRLPTRCPVIHGIMAHGNWSASEADHNLSQRLVLHCQDEDAFPVLIHPENGCTNGSGLMKFRSWPFSANCKVLPVAVSAWCPFPIATTYLGSTIIPDLFFHLFVPFTCYHVRALEPMSKKEEESPEEFASRVQQAIADSLGIETTQYTTNDRREFVKRLRQDAKMKRLVQQQRQVAQRLLGQQTGARSRVPVVAGQMSGLLQATGGGASVIHSSDLMGKVAQVQEVFPDIPEQAVLHDLAVTNCVDTTISNILDGRVTYTPQKPRSSQAGSSSTSSPATRSQSVPNGHTSYRPDLMQFGANAFSRSPLDRQLSFQERKQQMLKEARRRYLEKHSISSPP